MGEGAKVMREDFVCHYFIDLDKTRVGRPMSCKG